jgi:hypothetical protein
MDLLGNAQNAAGQGDLGFAAKVMEVAAFPSAPGSQMAWQRLLADAETSVEAIRGYQHSVTTVRDNAVAAIEEHREVVRGERDRLHELAEQVDALVHAVTSEQLAREYAEHPPGVSGR